MSLQTISGQPGSGKVTPQSTVVLGFYFPKSPTRESFIATAPRALGRLR
jgi:hypothetical protein